MSLSGCLGIFFEDCLLRSTCNSLMAIANELLVHEGFECVEIDWIASERALCVFIDRECSPVGLPDCVRASRILEESQLFSSQIPDSSRLEVSSPGVERPLRRPQDFEKYLGKLIKISLFNAVGGSKNWQGSVAAVDVAKGFELQGVKQSVCVEWDNLKRGNVVFNWNE